MEERIVGKTKSGFEFDVPKSVIDDMRVLDAVVELESGNSLAISRLCDQILGAEGKKKLYEHIKMEDGRVPISAVSEEIGEIFRAFGKPGKN